MLRAFVAFDPEKLPVMIFAQGEKDEPVLLKTMDVIENTLPAKGLLQLYGVLAFEGTSDLHTEPIEIGATSESN